MSQAKSATADTARAATKATPQLAAREASAEGAALNEVVQALGNQAAQLLLKARPFAGSVQVAPFDDPLEERADEAGVQTASRPQRLAPVPQAVVAAMRQAHATEPLDAAVRADAEQRLHAALPQVRVYPDSPAAPMLGARAFAFGHSVHLAPGAPGQHSAEGQALLHHELAHVDQQRRIGQAFIQREGPTKRTEGDWEIDEFADGFTIKYNARSKQIEIWAQGLKWVSITAPKTAAMPAIKLKSGIGQLDFLGSGSQITLRIDTEADLAVNVDQDVEAELFKRMPGDRAQVFYDLQGGGTATFVSTFDEVLAPGGYLALDADGNSLKQKYEKTREFALPMSMRITEERHVYINSDVPDGTRRFEQITADKLPNSFPTFDTLQGLQKFLDAAPQKDFMVLKMPDGKYVARRVDEKQMQQLANKIRGDAPDLGYLPNLARYNGAAAEGELVSFWMHGKEYSSLDSIRDLYYGDEMYASIGSKGAAPECEVYRMGASSFGRRPLTHAQALQLLEGFDRMSTDEVFKREVEGYPFVMMRMAGKNKRHDIDRRYFEGRDKFRASASRLDQLDSVDQKDEYLRAYRELDSEESRHFLMIELDREKDNAEFITLLKGTKRAQASVGKMVWNQVADHANFVAAREIRNGITELKPYAEGDLHLKNLVLFFGTMPDKKQSDALDFLGISAAAKPHFKKVLSNAQSAQRVIDGETVTETYVEWDVYDVPGGGTRSTKEEVSVDISLDEIRKAVRAQIANLDKSIVLLQARNETTGEYEFNALTASGDFGESVRRITYRDFGITLDPKSFPHGKVSPGWFPDALEGDRAKFSTSFEQVFANEANRHDSWEVALLIAKITAVALAAVAVMLGAHLIGLAVVAALGLEGGAAFVAYTATSAAVLTGFDLLQGKLLEGKNPTLKEALGSFLKNLLMVAAFTRLGKALEGVSVITRMSVMGATFLSVSFAEKMHAGGFESPRDFYLWMYSNIVTFAALEAGGRLIRPLDLKIQFWGRARRLTALAAEVDVHVGKVGKLQQRLGDVMHRPHLAANEGAALKADVKALLLEQKALAEKVAQKIRDSNDPEAQFVDKELKAELAEIEKALAGMEEADFLSALQLKPVAEIANAFEYKAGADAVVQLKKFFPEGTQVEASPDGVVRVQMAGQEQAFVLYPEGHTMLPVPKQGPVAGKLNLNEATAAEIVAAEISGVGKETADKIVEGRKEQGGLFSSMQDLLKIKGIGPATVAKLNASGKVEVAPKSKSTIIEIQAELRRRADAVIKRADAVGISDPSVDALRKFQVGATDAEIATAQSAVAKAEKQGSAKIDQAGKAARQKLEARDTIPKDWLKQVKVGRLSGVSDQAINDALTQIPSSAKSRITRIGPEQVRAIVLAHSEGVPIGRFLERSKGFSVEQRNRALRIYVEAVETGVSGVGRVLKEMSLQASKYRGGLFVLELAEHLGLRNIKEFEMHVLQGSTERFVDMVLKGDGIWVECKDWGEWQLNNPDKLATQFRKDVRLSGYDPNVFTQRQYVFSKPAPRALGEIRAFLREALVQELAAARASKAITADEEAALLAAFDAQKNMVSESALRDEHQLLQPDPGSAKTSPPIAVPPPQVKDDDEERAP
jgi:competence ComEA-like helix-hairpin-helix protein